MCFGCLACGSVRKKERRGGKGPALELDRHGWVKKLEPECWAETLLCTIDGNHYPSGKYTIFYQGGGSLEVKGAAKMLQRKSDRMVIEVDASKGAMFLRITKTDPKNPIRDIRVVMLGFVCLIGLMIAMCGSLPSW